MVKGSLGSYALLWQILQHLQEQVLEVIEVLDHAELLAKIDTIEVAELLEEGGIEGNALGVLGNLLGGEGAHYFKNCEKLVALCLAFENWREGEKFAQNTPSSPDVDRRVVLGDAEDKLRGAVIPRNNIRGVFALRVDLLAATEVADLDFAVL